MALRARALVVLSGCVLASIPALRALRAQDQTPAQTPAVQPVMSDRLVVKTRGRATAPADEVEFEFVVEGDSEDAKTAEKRHRDKLDRVIAALTGKESEKGSSDDDEESAKKKRRKKSDDEDSGDSKEEDKSKAVSLPEVGVPDKDGVVFEVREGRSTIGLLGNQNPVTDDMPAEKKAEGASIGVGTAVHAVFKNVSRTSPKKLRKLMAALLDRAADGGACMGSLKTPVRPAVRFRPKEPEALAKKAYEDAIAKGRARATELARLAGRQLGKLTVVTELDLAQQAQGATQQDGLPMFEGMIQTSDTLPGEATSGSTEVTVETVLQLEFDLK